MNRILSDNKIKALAVSILDDQKPNQILACQTGSTLIEIDLKNANFVSIPYQTLIFFHGQQKYVNESDGSENFNIEVDLSNNEHRFVSFKAESIKLYPGLSVFEALEGIPELSDSKAFPERKEFDNLCLFLLKKHARGVKLIRQALECGDFGDSVPDFIKGAAYWKMYINFLERTGYKPAKTGSILPIIHKEKTKKKTTKTSTNQNFQPSQRKSQVMLRIFLLELK